jgi:hypothetical protein
MAGALPNLRYGGTGTSAWVDRGYSASTRAIRGREEPILEGSLDGRSCARPRGVVTALAP